MQCRVVPSFIEGSVTRVRLGDTCPVVPSFIEGSVIQWIDVLH